MHLKFIMTIINKKSLKLKKGLIIVAFFAKMYVYFILNSVFLIDFEFERSFFNKSSVHTWLIASYYPLPVSSLNKIQHPHEQLLELYDFHLKFEAV